MLESKATGADGDSVYMYQQTWTICVNVEEGYQFIVGIMLSVLAISSLSAH